MNRHNPAQAAKVAPGAKIAPKPASQGLGFPDNVMAMFGLRRVKKQRKAK